MKKILQSATILVLSALVVFSACNKESDSSGTPTPVDSSTYKRIKTNLFAGTRTQPQRFEVDANTTEIIHGALNTKITFYPNSFKDQNGNIITSGQIDIDLVEMYTPGQVIANRSSATADGRLLKSAGQIYIKAYRAGIEVYANVYSVSFWQPADNQTPMDLFYGSNRFTDSIVNWTQAPRNAGTSLAGTILDTTGGQQNFFYQFDSCTNFNWINCDYFYDISGLQLTNLSLVMKDTNNKLNDTNTQVFLVFPSINSVTWMQAYTPSTRIFSLLPTYNVPVNMNFHAVSISLFNGTYYYSELKNLTSAYNFVDTLRPAPKTLPDVLTALSGL